METAWIHALWVAGALFVAGFAGWPLTILVFRLARTIDEKADEKADEKTDGPEAPASEASPGTIQTPPAVAVTETILRGGAIIGVLERFAVAVAVLAGQPVAIAYVVAIKGLGRFAELKETPAAAERFIIGTLTSMLWAAGVAAVVKIVVLG